MLKIRKLITLLYKLSSQDEMRDLNFFLNRLPIYSTALFQEFVDNYVTFVTRDYAKGYYF